MCMSYVISSYVYLLTEFISNILLELIVYTNQHICPSLFLYTHILNKTV